MEKVVDAVSSWISSPAKWWHFWMPQSGLVGGAIMSGALYLLHKLSVVLTIAPLTL